MRALNFVLLVSCLVIFAMGCQSTAPQPQSDDPELILKAGELTPVATGVNAELSYKAAVFGALYLYDFTSGQFPYEGHLDKGQKFVFEPASSRATINKETIDLNLVTNGKDEYRLFFIPQ